MAIDWSAPRLDDWEFYLIKTGGVNGAETRLNGVTGGSISWDYNSDTKVSGSLDFANFYMEQDNIFFNSRVRVYYCPTIEGKRQKYELCTGYVTMTSGTFSERLFSGSIEFAGELLRYEADQLAKDFVLTKGVGALDYYKRFHGWFGNAVYTWSGIAEKAFTATKVIEFGAKPLEVLQYIAKFLGGEIGTDTHGRITLSKYVAPAQKPIAYTFPVGEQCTIYGDLGVEETYNGNVNRVAVRHKWTDNANKEHVLYSTAVCASNLLQSSQNQGRWVTATYDESEMTPKTQARIDALAKTYLANNSNVEVHYEFSTFYVPVKIGDVVNFRYGKFNVDALVQTIDMDIKPGAPMKLKVKRVRAR